MLEGRGVLLGRVPGRGGGAKKGMLEGRGVLLGRVPGRGGGLKKVC